MNKMKKHSKKLAALLSAFQFFGSGAHKIKGMNLVKNLFSKSSESCGNTTITKEVLNNCANEIFNPSKDNKIFNYDYIEELQPYFKNTYEFVLKFGASYKEPGILTNQEIIPISKYYETWHGPWGFNEGNYSELTKEQKNDFIDCVALYVATDKCLGRQATLKQTDQMASIIGKGTIKTLGVFTLEVAAAILGIKYGTQQLDRWMDSRACKAEQREFDGKMKEQMGESSVDFTKSWEEIEKELNELRDEYPHNKDVINEIIELVHGYYVGVQLSIQDFSENQRG